MIDPDAYRVDFRTYEFIGFQPSNAVTYVRSDLLPAGKPAGDLLSAKGIVAGGLAADTSKDLLIRLTLDMLGVPYRYVTGYRSSNNARLALQRGEINLHSESTPGYFGVVEPGMVKAGEAVRRSGTIRTTTARASSVPKVMEGSAILSFPDFYRRAKGGPPMGPLWDAYRTNLATDQSMLRTIVMPPGLRRRPRLTRCAPLLRASTRTRISRRTHSGPSSSCRSTRPAPTSMRACAR